MHLRFCPQCVQPVLPQCCILLCSWDAHATQPVSKTSDHCCSYCCNHTANYIPDNITHQEGLMRLRHHVSLSIAGGKICVWPQAERRSFPTTKLDMSQLVHASATLVRVAAAGSLQNQLAQYVYCHGNCMLTRSHGEFESHFIAPPPLPWKSCKLTFCSRNKT